MRFHSRSILLSSRFTMSNPSDLPPSPPGTAAGTSHHQSPVISPDPTVPLLNLTTILVKIESVQKFLSLSVNTETLVGLQQMEWVSSELCSAIHQTIVNGAALLACSQSSIIPPPQITNPIIPSTILTVIPPDLGNKLPDPEDPPCKIEIAEENSSDEWETIELGSEELLAEHVHFCDICGKGFKRDANLRMHMRAHGNQFKTPEALAKPEKLPDLGRRRTRFSCPFMGCNRNKLHKKFKPLKSVICVKNHFKRSHCPKMYACERCNKKSFSVVADLRSHLKHCGETKWKCSCGTSFSRKDKLFGHMALFEGHMPAVLEEEEKGKRLAMTVEDEEDEDEVMEGKEIGVDFSDNGSLDGFLEGFGSMEDFCLQDMLNSPNGSGLGNEMDGFFNF